MHISKEKPLGFWDKAIYSPNMDIYGLRDKYKEYLKLSDIRNAPNAVVLVVIIIFLSILGLFFLFIGLQFFRAALKRSDAKS